MLKAMRWLKVSSVGKAFIVVLFAALLGNMLLAHKAAAGGPIMVGLTYISGTDRVSGKTYEDPHNMLGNNRTARTLLVNPGDSVRFYERIMNIDPPIIWILPTANCNYPVSVKYHRVYYDNQGNVVNDTIVNNFRSKPIYPLYNSAGFENYPRNAFDPTCYLRGMQPLPASSAVAYHEVEAGKAPGSASPGSQVCQYVETNPTVVDFLWIPQIVIGQHSFNSHNDYLRVPLPVLQNFPFLNMAIGDMMSCAEIAYNYNLKPIIESGQTGAGAATAGGAVKVNPYVIPDPAVDQSHATSSQNTEWNITRVIRKKGSNAPSSAPDSKAPCDHLSLGANYHGCTVVEKSSGKDTVFDAQGHVTAPASFTFPSTVPGPDSELSPNEEVCYMLSINAYKPYITTNTWRHSDLYCPPTVKKPLIHVLGDDTRVGGRIFTYQGVVGDAAKIFGSWGEYASYSQGSTVYSTGAGLRDGGPSSNLPLGYNTLTFANNLGDGAAPKFGSFGTANHINSVSAMTLNYFKQNAAALAGITSINLTDAPYSNGTTTTHSTGATPTSVAKPYLVDNKSGTPFTISGGSIPLGRTVIIVATGTVKITGDIAYNAGSIKKLDDIPQVVIVAHDIVIDDGVQNIDAWLLTDMTSGSIDTCASATGKIADATNGFTVNDCNRHLQVNGPVATKKLLLHRTVGADGDSLDQPAETFNNRGDAYLWALRYATDDRNLTTTKMVELPPRY